MSILYNSLVIGSNPKAYYRLNEASGTVATDSSGNALNGTITASGVTYSQAGAIIGDANKALLFNGTTGQVLAPVGLNTAGWNAITVECWVKLSNIVFAQSPRLVDNSHSDVDHNGFQLTIPTGAGSAKFGIGNGSSYAEAVGTFAFAANTYYHVVGTWDGTTITVYVNGVSKGTASISGSIGTPSSQVGLAYAPTYNGDFLPGTLDEVAIYNSVLSATTILEHYNVANQANGGSGLSRATPFTPILANDVNQAIAILQQPAGGQETGKYHLGGNAYATSALVDCNIYDLSRQNSTPVSVTIDTADQAPSGINAPTTATLKPGNIGIKATSTGIVAGCNCGGNYTLNF